MKYIAYGSNMNQEQMAHRCAGAQLIGTGSLYGYQLEFNRHATIAPTNNPLAAVPVAVWEISAEQEHQLDRYEGFPIYYRKLDCRVDMEDGKALEGMAYQMNSFTYNPPSQRYFEGIRDAYEALGLRSEIRQTLQPALRRSIRCCTG